MGEMQDTLLPPRPSRGRIYSMPRTKNGRRIALLSGAVLVAAVAVFVWASWERIRFFVEFESIDMNAQGYPEYKHRQTGIVFVALPGGTFSMGTSKEEAESLFAKSMDGSEWDEFSKAVLAFEQPRHKVTLSSFLIAKYEVTQAEWTMVMGNNPSYSKGDALPVTHVSWDDCQEFCQKLGLSLPTEAQWEYACRAGTSTAFAFGDTLTAKQANRKIKSVEVGSFQPNDFGLHDTHGNVSEWCEDVPHPGFYSTPEATQKDPLCRVPGVEHRAVRGNGRSALRGMAIRGAHTERTGFRPAWSWPSR